MKSLKILFVLIIFGLFFSCLNQTIQIIDDRVPEHIDFIINKIEELIALQTEDGLLESSLLVSRELNRGRLPYNEAEKLFNRIISNSNLDFSHTNSNYNVLTSYIQKQFPNLNVEIDARSSSTNIAELYFELAENNRLRSDPTLAIHYISLLSDQPDTLELLFEAHNEILPWYIVQARNFQNSEVLKILLEIADTKQVQMNDIDRDEVNMYVSQGWNADRAIEASVTVWVDLGIRIENNIGFPERSLGTGFYVSPAGHIITNYHVISSEVDPEYEGLSELFIRPSYDLTTRIPATVIGYDRILDIALLKAEISPTSFLSFDFYPNLSSGNSLFVVGSPGGLQNSVTSGIVSAQGRRLLQIGDFIQVDAPVNPGNSGGPLFDAEGSLIGVIFAGIEQYEGVNFAIPSTWIRYIFPQLFDSGEVVHPWLGLSVRETRRGLEIQYIVPNSPAETAGFEVNEIITMIDNFEVESIPDAQAILLSNPSKQLYEITVRSENETKFRLVYSDDRPFSPLEGIIETSQLANVWLPPLFGMSVSTTAEDQRRYRITDVYPGSIADESGLNKNDVFQLYNWFVDEETRLAILQILIQRQSNGYISEGLQLANFIELNSFI